MIMTEYPQSCIILMADNQPMLSH